MQQTSFSRKSSEHTHNTHTHTAQAHRQCAAFLEQVQCRTKKTDVPHSSSSASTSHKKRTCLSRLATHLLHTKKQTCLTHLATHLPHTKSGRVSLVWQRICFTQKADVPHLSSNASTSHKKWTCLTHLATHLPHTKSGRDLFIRQHICPTQTADVPHSSNNTSTSLI